MLRVEGGMLNGKIQKSGVPKSGDATTILHLLSLTIPLKGLFEQLNFADEAGAVRVEAVVRV